MGKSARRGRSDVDHGRNITRGERRGNYRDKMSQRAQERAASNPDHGREPTVNIRKKLEYLTDNQRLMGASVRVNDCTFATGPAGTGKTHVAIAEMLPWLFKHKDNKFILTNPATEIGEKLGTLPGDKDEKIAISTRPLRNILINLLGASAVDNLVANGKVMFEPLGSILGLTFDDALIVFDEAQNSTPQQMKALLTRVGQRSKIVLAGDYREQLFIDGPSGLADALKRLGNLPGVGHIDFTVEDIVRGPFCKSVIEAYRVVVEN